MGGSKKRLLFLLIGLIVAIGVASEVVSVMTVGTESVDVASQTIPAGTKIDSSMITTKLVKTSDIEPEAILANQSIHSSYAIARIPSGTQLTRANLSIGSSSGLETQVPKGYIAYKLPVDQITGLTSKLKVGNQVDVIVSIPNYKNGSQTTYDTGIIESNCLVLGVSTDSSGTLNGVMLALYPNVALDISEITALASGSTYLVRLAMPGYANQHANMPNWTNYTDLRSLVR